MRSTNGYLQAAIGLSLVLITTTGLFASDFEQGDSYTGVKLGEVGSAHVDIAGREADQTASFTGGVFCDLPFGNRLHYGLSADPLVTFRLGIVF